MRLLWRGGRRLIALPGDGGQPADDPPPAKRFSVVIGGLCAARGIVLRLASESALVVESGGRKWPTDVTFKQGKRTDCLVSPVAQVRGCPPLAPYLHLLTPTKSTNVSPRLGPPRADRARPGRLPGARRSTSGVVLEPRRARFTSFGAAVFTSSGAGPGTLPGVPGSVAPGIAPRLPSPQMHLRSAIRPQRGDSGDTIAIQPHHEPQRGDRTRSSTLLVPMSLAPLGRAMPWCQTNLQVATARGDIHIEQPILAGRADIFAEPQLPDSKIWPMSQCKLKLSKMFA